VRRVAVLGCEGSGKTVLARDLASRLGLPIVHADFLRYDAGEPVPEELWQARHEAAIAADEWVFDGMKLAFLDRRLERADTAIFLDLPRRACLAGVLRRRRRYRGRIEAEAGVADRIDLEFLRWIWRFRRDYRPRVLAALERHAATTQVVVLPPPPALRAGVVAALAVSARSGV
jgi:adenylate kinase family enzyme